MQKTRWFRLAFVVALMLALAGLVKANDKAAAQTLADDAPTMCAAMPAHNTAATLLPAVALAVVPSTYVVLPPQPALVRAVLVVRGSSFHAIVSARRAAVMVWHPPRRVKHSDGGWSA